MLKLKRAYDAAEPSDGYRVLVDRLWPRGISRTRLALDAWLKELAPSDELRRFFAHDVSRFEEFARRYSEEIRSRPGVTAVLDELARRASDGDVTLVFAARDESHNNAAVLRSEIERRIKPPRKPRRRSG